MTSATVDGVKRSVFIRVDSNELIGAGHFSRCYALGLALFDLGCEVTFFCKSLLPSHTKSILSSRFRLEMRENSGESEIAKEIFRDYPKSKIILVDSYDIFGVAALEHLYLFDSTPVFGFSDVNGQASNLDYIINVNVGVTSDHYKLIDQKRLILGEKYAPLAPEYSQGQALCCRRQKVRLNHLLISLGAGDTIETVLKIFKALQGMSEKLDTLTVVLGTQAELPINFVNDIHSKFTHVRIYKYVDNMANIYSAADLAIGGGGVSLLERCAIGLPSICISLSEDQNQNINYVVKNGAGWRLADPFDELPFLIGRLIHDPQELKDVGNRAAAVVDGKGATRLASEILVRQVQASDGPVHRRWLAQKNKIMRVGRNVY